VGSKFLGFLVSLEKQSLNNKIVIHTVVGRARRWRAMGCTTLLKQVHAWKPSHASLLALAYILSRAADPCSHA